MHKPTLKTLTAEIFQQIYTDKDFRNAVATAHKCCDQYGVFKHFKALAYPLEYIVTEEQISQAKAERERAKQEAIAQLGSKLVFVGMGADYTGGDDIGNHRIRTTFYNERGNLYFIEFCKGKEKQAIISHAIDRTKEIALNGNPDLQREYYNFKNLEMNLFPLEYSKAALLDLVNEWFHCRFTALEVDNYDLAPDDFICQSPRPVLDFGVLGGVK